ncbi:Hypothetical predicted protein [Cloeon dipterum]|uniref:Uncharacterized protein n=1 Tax=Cloeon dipterum TaxID=197152 RepID=A0A8S1CV58_9INSE|nr:Hypothetical predicted protein [Cloeon dipterum]
MWIAIVCFRIFKKISSLNFVIKNEDQLSKLNKITGRKKGMVKGTKKPLLLWEDRTSNFKKEMLTVCCFCCLPLTTVRN